MRVVVLVSAPVGAMLDVVRFNVLVGAAVGAAVGSVGAAVGAADGAPLSSSSSSLPL